MGAMASGGSLKVGVGAIEAMFRFTSVVLSVMFWLALVKGVLATSRNVAPLVPVATLSVVRKTLMPVTWASAEATSVNCTRWDAGTMTADLALGELTCPEAELW